MSPSRVRAAGVGQRRAPVANAARLVALATAIQRCLGGVARYTIPAGERVLYGQRVNGVVRLTDVPLAPGGRAYLVERELEQDGNAALKALVADYVDQGQRHGEVPMHIPLGRYLAHIED